MTHESERSEKAPETDTAERTKRLKELMAAESYDAEVEMELVRAKARPALMAAADEAASKLIGAKTTAPEKTMTTGEQMASAREAMYAAQDEKDKASSMAWEVERDAENEARAAANAALYARGTLVKEANEAAQRARERYQRAEEAYLNAVEKWRTT